MYRWQRLALALAAGLTMCAGTATAQTVIVKGAPASARTELLLNGTSVAAAGVDAEGLATLDVPEANAPANQIEAHVYVDRCADLIRVLIVEGSLAPTVSAGACARQALPGFFIVRRRTTFVIDVANPTAALWLTQGRVPPSWLLPGPIPESSSAELVPNGLVLFGGAGLAMSPNLSSIACGTTVPVCDSSTRRRLYAGGAALWLTANIAAEAQYISPGDAKVEGSDTALSFNSSLDTRLLSIAALAGGPVGRARLYARGGMIRSRAVLLTTQTVEDREVVVGEETQTIPGASQTLELRTTGWGYIVGGGFEIWLSRMIGLYGDVNRASLRGKATDGSDSRLNDTAWLGQVGVRVHLGR